MCAVKVSYFNSISGRESVIIRPKESQILVYKSELAFATVQQISYVEIVFLYNFDSLPKCAIRELIADKCIIIYITNVVHRSPVSGFCLW